MLTNSHDTALRKALASLLVLMLALVAGNSYAETPLTDQPAPDFTLKDQNGKSHSLSSYCGQWVAIYFYPKDDTPGCTTQACEFRDDIYKYRKANIKLIGISLDDVESHQEFAAKYSLPFTLLSDRDKEIAKAYGVLKNYGVVKYTARETFLVNPEGVIAKHYKKVDPEGHSEDVLNTIKTLSAPMAK